jgi:hypothetical protein
MTATMTVIRPPRGDWLVPTALIMLAFVPVAAGAARMIELSSGAEITPENTGPARTEPTRTEIR